MKQPDLFGRRPSKPSVAARQSVPPRPMVVDHFTFDGSDPRLDPQPDAVIPDEIKLPTDNPDWQPSRG